MDKIHKKIHLICVCKSGDKSQLSKLVMALVSIRVAIGSPPSPKLYFYDYTPGCSTKKTFRSITQYLMIWHLTLHDIKVWRIENSIAYLEMKNSRFYRFLWKNDANFEREDGCLCGRNFKFDAGKKDDAKMKINLEISLFYF